MTTEVLQTETETRSDTDGMTRQYISFTIGAETYAVKITMVREIKGWIPTTSLPNAPDYMRGVINLRGVIVPVFDMRTRFGRGRTEPGKTHVVIIVTLEERTIGILVDAVSDILTIAAEDILAVPDQDANPEYAFMEGLVSVNEKMIAIVKPRMLFDMNKIPDMDLAGNASDENTGDMARAAVA
ncbi:chemotaxis protein CheW [Paremcibacter congregatus]|uniref:Chemotaxis protein CheW n=1 Tax=Paremcibacter congregatus TaxID=2043170 RepID=A0A2G4YP31_9PROT|nr:chemotaxis protein CheW [Paremcibacter congregatus]PHZ84074.1 chemotaxis protein CheW [Paremcibacter congregatus]QDE25865.1 purine-binding chemotaxis protein CheW [Paremcibacter congregatus]